MHEVKGGRLDWTISPSGPLTGELRVPGDKSISHRLAMLSLLSSETAVLEGFLTSEDCLNTLNAVAALGATVTRQGTRVQITGAGGRVQSPSGPIDCGNSGTGIRLLTGLIAGLKVDATLTGDASLRSRPMRRIQQPLERMGARIELLGPNGCAPIRVRGGALRGMHYELPVASAQVKSCVLLAGLTAEGPTTVVEPMPTRDHTELLLRALGHACETDGLTITLRPGVGGSYPDGRLWRVPGDFSSAAFWIVAAAMRPGCKLTLRGVGLNPRRTALLEVLRAMGAGIEVRATAADWEPLGDIVVTGGRLRGVDVGGALIPNLIDELPILMVAAAMAEGRTVVRDAAELRVKESDRIATTVRTLNAFGVAAEEQPDGMIVTGGRPVTGGCTVDSRGDHRIAMAAAVLALSAGAPARIEDVACVDTSYPGFLEQLETLTAHG